MNSSFSEQYTRYCRPTIGSILQALRIDIRYHRASGNYLYYYDGEGEEVRVLDFLGGYGAALFGHNYPPLVDVMQESLNAEKPFCAQASCRSSFARLSEKLSSMLEERTGRQYVIIGTNSGAEAVEAAIKHAEFRYQTRVKRLGLQFGEVFDTFESDYKTGRVALSDQFISIVHDAASGINAADQQDDFLTAVKMHNLNLLSRPSIILGLKGAFHGKTSGAVQLTDNQAYRLPFQGLGPSVSLINHEELEARVKQHHRTLYWPILNDEKRLELKKHTLSPIAAMFLEPLQGEGGIKVIPDTILKQFRATASNYDIPLVFDEIQCGMGRTGTFLYSEQTGVSADYYLLSKSLGGGLTKIGVLAVEADQFTRGFDAIHSSTFAEDDHSAEVALKALSLLDENTSIYDACKTRGEFLKTQLFSLMKHYPDVIADVRGQGLMLGVELQSQDDSPSNALALFSRQNMLGYLASGYLLHEHKIRVAPTLTSTTTIRLEPSAFIEEDHCRELIHALQQLCLIISNQNMYRFARFIIGEESVGDTENIENYAAKADSSRPQSQPGDTTKQIAFIGHFFESWHIKLWEESFEPFSSRQCGQFIRRIHQVVKPTKHKAIEVRSANGDSVILNFYGICVDAATIGRHMQAGTLSIIKEKIADAVDMAVQSGCTLIGFGGYTSIVTHNCTDIVTGKIGLTTGNSLATGMGYKAMLLAAEQADINLQNATAAAIGANGNICSVYCELLAEKVGTLVLIGRPGREDRLGAVAAQIYQQAFARIIAGEEQRSTGTPGIDGQQDGAKPLTGIARTISNTRAVTSLLQKKDISAKQEAGAYLAVQLQKELGENTPIRISTSTDAIADANLIVSASNSPEPIIFPHHLHPGPCVICDISAPMDTDRSVHEARPDVIVFQGGLVELPCNKDFKIDGMAVRPSTVFACMGETLLLGLSGISGNYSYGRITKNQVRFIMGLADLHGFSLAMR